MKKILMHGLMISAGLLATVSCTDDFNPDGSATGKIFPVINLDTSAPLEAPKVSRATTSSAREITADDLTLRVIPDDKSKEPREMSVAEINNASFVVGKYTIEAFYGNKGEEGIGKAYYYGAAAVNVTDGGTSQVSLPVSLANSMVSIDATGAFKTFFTDYSFELEHSDAVEASPVACSMTEPVYMNPGQLSLYANVTRADGKEARLLAANFTASAKKHYSVSVDINGGDEGHGTGAASLTITFIDELDGEETVEIELNDELFTTEAPAIELSGYDATDVYNFIEGDLPADLAPSLFVKAPGKIKSIVMTYESAWLSSMNIGSSPVTLNGNDNHSALVSLGIEGKYNNVEKFATIELRKLLANITYINGSNNETRLGFKVVDMNNKESEPVVISVTIDHVTATMATAAPLLLGQDYVDLDIEYNGKNLANDVKFQFKNDRGTWSDAVIESVSPASRATSSSYIVRVKGNFPSGDIELQMLKKDTGEVLTKINIARSATVDMSLSYAVEDIYATRATLKLASEDANTSKLIINEDFKVALSTDGSTYTNTAFTASGDKFSLSGLTPSTKYWVKVSLGESEAFLDAPFTTEAAPQLPNGNMETWSRTEGKTKYWWIEYPGESAEASVWGTMNLLTTSEGGSSTSAFNSNRDGCAYNAFSGTRVTTDSYSGNAAIIETVGWGKGNSASGSTGANACKKITVGELYLGKYEGGAKYGYPFTGRPSGISFYYKYTHKNSADYGVAIVKLFNGDTEVASATKNLGEGGNVSAYTKVTMPLTYSSSAITSIQVIFKSSGNAACQSISNDNLSCPSFGNLSDGRFVGSSLYIDEITLNY